MKKKIIQHRNRTEYNNEEVIEKRRVIKGKDWVDKEFKKIKQISTEVEEKYCPSCKRWLELNNFGKKQRAWDKLYNICKQCRKEGKVLDTNVEMLEPSEIEDIKVLDTNKKVLDTKEKVLDTNKEVLDTNNKIDIHKVFGAAEERYLQKQKQLNNKPEPADEYDDTPYDML